MLIEKEMNDELQRLKDKMEMQKQKKEFQIQKTKRGSKYSSVLSDYNMFSKIAKKN